MTHEAARRLLGRFHVAARYPALARDGVVALLGDGKRLPVDVQHSFGVERPLSFRSQSADQCFLFLRDSVRVAQDFSSMDKQIAMGAVVIRARSLCS
jgi:hypothetical protein